MGLKGERMGKTVDLNKALEIPNFGTAGRLMVMKGDPMKRTCLVTQDFGNGTVNIICFEEDGKFTAFPTMPSQCLVQKNVIK